MNIAIIGAGPCGIISAIEIKKNNPTYSVTLYEQNKEIGSRIKISGNGRCNFFNANISKEKYSNFSPIENILRCKEKLFSLLDESGLSYYFDEEGRYYPTSESSSTIIYCLEKLLIKYKVNVMTNIRVDCIGENLKILGIKYDKIIVAIGGISYNNDKLNYNSMIHYLSLTTSSMTPSLTPVSTSSFSNKMEGKRIKTLVRLYNDSHLVKEEYGEVIFKKDGVSGIVILNMSSYLARLHLKDYSHYHFEFDLLPKMKDSLLLELIDKDKSLRNLFIKEIADEILSRKGNIFDNIRKFKLNIRGLYEFKYSQVTSGGVSLECINKNLSLKNNPNIFVGGEFIDVDGECGGYNIAFALLSGIYIAKEI